MSYSICETYESIDLDDPTYVGFNYIIADAVNENIEILLPESVWDGFVITIIREDVSATYTCTITAKTGTTIANTTSILLDHKQSVELVNFNTNWIAPIINLV